MELIKLWFQDWSDACEYAKECAPDLSFAIPEEPYSALASIAAACFLLWWWNERQLKKLRRAAVAKDEIRPIGSGDVAHALGWARMARSETKKKAA
jgi:hypothetical protein